MSGCKGISWEYNAQGCSSLTVFIQPGWSACYMKIATTAMEMGKCLINVMILRLTNLLPLSAATSVSCKCIIIMLGIWGFNHNHYT